jgi:hypothetical protein
MKGKSSMAIYTRFGLEVTLCDARLIPVWIETGRGSIKWHYEKPKLSKNRKVEEYPQWHYRGWLTESGRPVCDNKWVAVNTLRADDGIKEINNKLDELNPDHVDKFSEWNKEGAPEASHFFPQASEKEIA